MNDGNLAGDGTKSKPAKKSFVVRETPAWLDQHQDWISDGARELYKVLRTLADVKTGKLFIPGRGWIRIRTIEQKSGMSPNTRKKYMRELRVLGAYTPHRDYVTRRINGRNLKVKGQMQITIHPLHAPNPRPERLRPTDQNSQSPETLENGEFQTRKGPIDAVSPTDQTGKVDVLPPQQRVSPTDQNSYSDVFSQFFAPPTDQSLYRTRIGPSVLVRTHQSEPRGGSASGGWEHTRERVLSPLPNPSQNHQQKLGVGKGELNPKALELWKVAAGHGWRRDEFDDDIRSQTARTPLDSLPDDDYQKLKTHFEGFPPGACKQCGKREVCEHLQADVEKLKRLIRSEKRSCRM